MIRIGDKYIRGDAVVAVAPYHTDAENWSTITFASGHWVSVNAPAAVVVDRIRLDEACGDVNCTEVHDG